MTNKLKLVISLIASFLIMCVVGLTIAIVVVANIATIGSSMSIMYLANNVACTINASANIVNNENGVTGIYVEPSNIVVQATDSSNGYENGEVVEKEHNIGNIQFADVELDAGWRVVYTFNITNDATDAEGAKPIIAQYMFANVDFDEQNVIVKVGSTEENAAEFADGEDLVYYTNSIQPQKSENIVIVVSILNYFEVVNLEMSNFLTISQVS